MLAFTQPATTVEKLAAIAKKTSTRLQHQPSRTEGKTDAFRKANGKHSDTRGDIFLCCRYCRDYLCDPGR